MRILDNYIIKSISIIFISTIIIFCFLYILIDTTTNLDEIIDRKVPFGILVQYYMSMIPIVLVQTSSIACLIATLFTFSRLNNENEIIAMRTNGLSFWQITKPALIFGLIVAISVFWLNEKFIPKANARAEQIKTDNLILETDRIEKKQSIKNLTFYGLRNRLYFIDSLHPQTHELRGITITEYDDNQNIKQKTVALKGSWTGIAWKFYQCQITSFEENDLGAPIKIKVYKEKLMDIQETPEDFLRQRLKVSLMNIKQLNEYISRFKSSGASKALNNLRVDMHQKIAYPIGNFVVVLIGLPFALMIRSRKGTTFSALGIAIAVGFLFYVATAVTLAFGKGGFFPPFLAAWATPILFGIVAITVIETDFS